MVPRTAYSTLYYVANTQLLRDLLEIAGDAALVLHHRSAADHFQVLDLGEIRQQLILDPVSKVSVLFFVTQIFQRQHCNALVGDRKSGNLRS